MVVPKQTDEALVFTVYGEPVPLPRHRLARGRMFNPSAKLQKDFAAACSAKLPLAPLEGAIEATMIFYFKRPKSHYGTGKNAQTMKPAAVAAGVWHSKKKDLDNLVKFVLDSLNGRAYLDDAQVRHCLTRLDARVLSLSLSLPGTPTPLSGAGGGHHVGQVLHGRRAADRGHLAPAEQRRRGAVPGLSVEDSLELRRALSSHGDWTWVSQCSRTDHHDHHHPLAAPRVALPRGVSSPSCLPGPSHFHG